MDFYRFAVPGFEGSDRVGFLDIESEKVPVLDPPEGWPEWKGGKPCPSRHRAFMIGLGWVQDGRYLCEIVAGAEQDLVYWVSAMSLFFDEFHYNSRNRFDEAVLKGQFANARRRLFTGTPPWPHVAPSLEVNWVQITKDHVLPRLHPDDVSSKECPEIWNERPLFRPKVILHNFLDILGMPVTEGWKYPEETVHSIISGEVDFKDFQVKEF